MPRKRKTLRLITHRSVAEMLDLNTTTLRNWVALGEFPEPHSVIAQTWFYDAAVIEHYVRTGRWPDGARFRATLPRPELSRATADA